MTAEEIRELDVDELAAKETETREQMFRLRFQLGMGQADGLKKYRTLRKDLARLLTVRHQKASQAEQGS
jgi:large subunit ribosomal protein L29